MALCPGEICGEEDSVFFSTLQQRLIQRLKDEIRAGKLTERALARRSGLSQPHIHNLLKGIRSPTAESADALLRAISASVPDLLRDSQPDGSETQTGCDAAMVVVQFLCGEVGPGGRWDDTVDEGRHIALPGELVAGIAQPAMVRVLADHEMSGIAGRALIELRVRMDSIFPERDVYVLARGGEARLRYIRIGRRRVYFPTVASLNRPREWEFEPFGAELARIVRARVCRMYRDHGRAAASL